MRARQRRGGGRRKKTDASAQRVTFTCRGCSAELFSRLAKGAELVLFARIPEPDAGQRLPSFLHFIWETLLLHHPPPLVAILSALSCLPSRFCSVLFLFFFSIQSACRRRAANIPFPRTRSRHEDVKVTRYIFFPSHILALFADINCCFLFFLLS